MPSDDTRELFRIASLEAKMERLANTSNPEQRTMVPDIYAKKSDLAAIQNSLNNTIDYLTSVIEQVEGRSTEPIKVELPVQKTLNIPVTLSEGGTGAITLSQAQTNLGITAITVTTITSAASPYSATGNQVVLVNATGGAVTVSLPSAVTTTTPIEVKKTDSSSNAITVDPVGAQTVDGAATYLITLQYESAKFISDGTNWFVF